MNFFIAISLFLLAGNGRSQEAYPPPPKEESFNQPAAKRQKRGHSTPSGSRPHTASPLIAPEHMNNTQKYEYCFNKMIDLEKADNSFMRSCLGLAPRSTQPQKSEDGAFEFLDAKIIKEVFEKSQNDFKQCFTEYAKEERKRGIVINGLFEPIITIQPTGAVSSARLSKRSLTAPQLDVCLKKSLLALTFPKYSSKKIVSAYISYKMNSPRGQISLNLTKKPVRLRGIPGYTETEKMAVYRAGLPKISACYYNLQKNKPDITGRTGVKLKVSAQGKVVDVQILENTIYDSPFNECVINALKTYKFPPPRTNSLTNVHFPFIFTHKIEDIQ